MRCPHHISPRVAHLALVLTYWCRLITPRVSGTRSRKFHTHLSSTCASRFKRQKNCMFLQSQPRRRSFAAGGIICQPIPLLSHASADTLSWTTAAVASSFSTSSIAAYSASAAANCTPIPIRASFLLIPSPSLDSYCAEIASAIGQLHSAHIIYRYFAYCLVIICSWLMPHAEISNPKIFFWTPKVSVLGTFVFIWVFVFCSKKNHLAPHSLPFRPHPLDRLRFSEGEHGRRRRHAHLLWHP
jgi:hypothetical protein